MNSKGLYAITPDGLAGERLIERVDAALRGGAKLVQYRDKQRDLRLQTGLTTVSATLTTLPGPARRVNLTMTLTR